MTYISVISPLLLHVTIEQSHGVSLFVEHVFQLLPFSVSKKSCHAVISSAFTYVTKITKIHKSFMFFVFLFVFENETVLNIT